MEARGWERAARAACWLDRVLTSGYSSKGSAVGGGCSGLG